ncbi:MAG TPA: C39 family peptidase [Polyangiaceae bacterium]|nr:C39 family peptidase [Polyangiaceae bacterium]
MSEKKSSKPGQVDVEKSATKQGASDTQAGERRRSARRKGGRRRDSRRATARRSGDRAELPLEVLPQPDDTTCGPTCLHAVYRYFGDEIELDKVVREVRPLAEGGTLAVWLANHALRRGYRATIHTYNLQTFDPTWFARPVSLIERLRRQLERKHDPKLRSATEAYVEFLELGGKIFLGDRTSRLIRRYLKLGLPILTGLSATYLYSCAREKDDVYDDVEGEPLGHFVVLSGYDQSSREVMVADPLRDNPRFGQQYYSVNIERLVSSILLGIVTYDANLLILEPREKGSSPTLVPGAPGVPSSSSPEQEPKP